ncbi:hypothetical protein [Streptomyces sp. AC602_WCS936]|uniref:hypothetical protein n=1 Tax=Streptomyces sp. AC602_WCS936 TaxID=2823685 RepID=UPI001C26D33C|nr:hypothetical protein [Streptomyces sp. AC602_WCS936]
MGVDVILVQVRQQGTSSKGRKIRVVDSVPDESDVFADLSESAGLPMLQRVDPYGSLILTAQQMEQFLLEIRELRSGCDRTPHSSQLERIDALAVRCAGDSSLELHLEGD